MFKARIGLFGISALVTGGTTYLAFTLGKFRLHKVEGPSMRPTLNPSDSFFRDIILVKIINKEEAKNIPLSSVVCLEHPKLEKGYLVKRLIAHENQAVEKYKKPRGGATQDEERVPAGHCWVESDAGPGYLDSSYLGPVSYEKVDGQALYVIWPPQRLIPLL